jgi:hypothetical protein
VSVSRPGLSMRDANAARRRRTGIRPVHLRVDAQCQGAHRIVPRDMPQGTGSPRNGPVKEGASRSIQPLRGDGGGFRLRARGAMRAFWLAVRTVARPYRRPSTFRGHENSNASLPPCPFLRLRSSPCVSQTRQHVPRKELPVLRLVGVPSRCSYSREDGCTMKFIPIQNRWPVSRC